MGFFISFEGAEGSGKSTQIKLLTEYLKEKGFPVAITREPGGTRIGEKIRKILLSPVYQEMNPMTEVLLYAADRAQNLHQLIAPALERNMLILTDRFMDASLVYQGVAQGLGKELVERINDMVLKGLRPNLTLLLDIDPFVGMQRIKEKEDRIEAFSLSFHEKVREAYLQLAREDHRFIILDASLEIEVLHQQIKEEVMIHLRRVGLHATQGF